MNNITIFHLKIIIFTAVKNCIISHRLVVVMHALTMNISDEVQEQAETSFLASKPINLNKQPDSKLYNIEHLNA